MSLSSAVLWQLSVCQPTFPVWSQYSCVSASSTCMSSLQEKLQENLQDFSWAARNLYELCTCMTVQSITWTHFSLPLIFAMFLIAILTQLLVRKLPTTVLITTGACQCRSTQRDSSAFRKNHCDKAPVTNWNCGKDKHCSSIMLCKHKTGIISWQCWEKIGIFFIKKDIQSTYDVSQRQSNHAYPSVKQEQVYAPHKFPWIALKSPHKLCKKLPVENIWQSTGMRNILIFYEFDNNLRLLILLGLQSYLEDNYFSNKSMIIPGWKAGVIWKHNYQILCKTRHLINPLAQGDWLCQGWEQKNVCLLFWWFP